MRSELSASAYPLTGGKIAVSVSGNALTAAIKTSAGNDPSPTEPVYVTLQSSPAVGDIVIRTITTAVSITVPNGASFQGVTSINLPFRLHFVLFYDDGTFRLAVINCVLSPNSASPSASGLSDFFDLAAFGAASSTAISATTLDYGKFYTGVAVSSKAYVTVGFADWESGLPTSLSQWDTAPTSYALFGLGTPTPGSVVHEQTAWNGSMQTGTTTVPWDNTTPQSGEGDILLTATFIPRSKVNIIEVEAQVVVASSVANLIFIMALFQDSGSDALMSAAMAFPGTTDLPIIATLKYQMRGNIAASTTFKIRGGPSGAATVTLNGAAGAAKLNGTMASHITIKELAA